MKECNEIETPIENNLKIIRNDLKIETNETREGNKKPVKELIGCLMFSMLGTRPVISFAINFSSRYQSNTDFLGSFEKNFKIFEGHIKYET